MLIKTSNTRLQNILSGTLMHQDDATFSTDAASATVLANLAKVLNRDYSGEWAVELAPCQGTAHYKELLGVDAMTEQSMFDYATAIGASNNDFVFWLEQIYGQPVTQDNHKRVTQLFRLWYAATSPGKHQEPPVLSAANKGKQDQRSRRAVVVKGKGWGSEEALLTYLAAHPELIPPPEEVPADKKWCPMCETWKDRAEFHKDKNRGDGLTGRCKGCHHKRKATK